MELSSINWDIYRDGSQPPPPYGSPVQGDMDADDCAALAEVLSAHTSTPERCWFAIWEGYGWLRGQPGFPLARTPYRNYMLFTGAASAATGFRSEPWFQTPTIWWPQDRAWVVATEVDSICTYVAASAVAVQALLACDRLEALPSDVHDKVDVSPYHDRPNGGEAG